MSLKKALLGLGINGGTRSKTERNQWVAQKVSKLTATNHLLKEQTETLTGDKEKLLSENEKLEKQ